MYAWRKCTLFCVKKVCGMFAGLRKISTFASAISEIAQLVEHNLAKVRVASSSLVFRSKEKTSEKYIDLFYLSWRECRKRKKVKSINIDIPSSRCFSQIIRNGNIY